MTHLQNGSCIINASLPSGEEVFAWHCTAGFTYFSYRTSQMHLVLDTHWRACISNWQKVGNGKHHTHTSKADVPGMLSMPGMELPKTHILFWARRDPPRSSPSWLWDKACRSTLQNSTSPELHVNYKVYLFQEECIPFNWDRVPCISHVPSGQSCDWGHFLRFVDTEQLTVQQSPPINRTAYLLSPAAHRHTHTHFSNIYARAAFISKCWCVKCHTSFLGLQAIFPSLLPWRTGT